MSLRAGLRVGPSSHMLGAWDARRRLSLSGGTVREAGIVLARDDWREPNDDEIALLVASGDALPDLAVFTTPAWVRREFWSLDVEAMLAPRPGAEAPAEVPKYHARLVEWLQFIDAPLPAVASVRVMASAPGRASVNVDPTTGRAAGIARVPDAVRAVVNVGETTHAVLWINRPWDELDAGGGAERFFEDERDYPVVRLDLAPGEGCFGPFDRVLHDATTVGCAGPDVWLQIAGASEARDAVAMPRR